MYKLILLIAAASTQSMIPEPACIEDANTSKCHFEGTKNICACSTLKK